MERNSRDVPNDPKQATILSASITTRAQIQNSLDLDEPKRITITTIPESNSDYTQYTNEKFGVSFAVPTTWAGQSLDPVDENTPDFVTVGPLINGNPTVLQFKTVSLSNITADEYLDNFKAIINEDITSGFLDVISEEEIVVDGNVHLSFHQYGIFLNCGNSYHTNTIQATIVGTDEIYQLVYLIDGNRTSEKQSVFERALETFTVSDSKQITSTPDDINDKSLQDNSQEGGCLVATAAFNTELSPEIQQLREFRDDIVLKTESGSIFMTNFNQIYYSFSPILADAERDNPALQLMIRSTLTPLFSSLLLLDQLNIDSEIEMLTYGIGIIILNLTLYIIAPILLAYKIRNIFGVKLNLKHTSKIQ
ncbi:MAG: CFI-box-CTERM domain-containing protein [Candidatus Nitrosoabyssus spongiisocia]|nr:MAG: CFI-box-CTERM domain-containing protein [Nitrosopumilaceae archaeon AB1(1)]